MGGKNTLKWVSRNCHTEEREKEEKAEREKEEKRMKDKREKKREKE